MEQFQHVGEVLGSLRALMVLQDEIQINQRQCCLLVDIFSLAFNTIAEHIRENLRLEEKSTKWKILDKPLEELYRVFKEGELYIRDCLDVKYWWGKVILLHQNKECVEFHIHNLLSHFPAVIEAIENAGEISGLDLDEMQKRRLVLARKYDKEWNDATLFQWRFGKEYLVPHEICRRLESAWREDRWLLIEAIQKKKSLGSVVLTKNEQQLADFMLKKLTITGLSNHIFPSWILLGGKDYQVRRRLGGGNQYKEIQWLGESLAIRHFFADVTESLNSEICTLSTLSHPNILQYLCGFCDEERKEYFLVMELLNKDLNTLMRENSSARRRFLFSLPVVVDLMLQVARGMEYLHSQKIYHGDLNPSNILLKPRSSIGGFFYAKVMGYGLSSVKKISRCSTPQNVANPFIWYAPEVLAEQDKLGCISRSKCTEKADVYSYGMLCFQLLTGKSPFEDKHLQGDKISRNIRAGERPLFPSLSPKYLVSLTKKCWKSNPSQRPSFSSICRILRYIQKFLLLNPCHGQPQLHLPHVDYYEVETSLNKSPGEVNSDVTPVWQIPFQMFAFSLVEKAKDYMGFKEKNWDSCSEAMSMSICREDNPAMPEDPSAAVSESPHLPSMDTRSVCSAFHVTSDARSVFSEAPMKKMPSLRRSTDVKAKKNSPGLPRSHSARHSPLSPCGRSLKTNRGSQLPTVMGGNTEMSTRHLPDSGIS